MLFRRKLITNFIWIIAMIIIIIMGGQYAFLYGVDFLFAGDGFFATLVNSSYNSMDIGLLVWIVIYLAMCVGVYLIGRIITNFFASRYEINHATAGFFKIILICLVFIGAIIYRSFMMIHADMITLTDIDYYDAAAALFTEDASLGDLAVHGASYVYIMLLSFIMQFLGDQEIAVVLLQILIQIITIMVVFALFYRLINFWAGFIASLILTVSPLYSSKVFTSNPGCFVALLVVLSMYMISRFKLINGGVVKGICGFVFGLIIGYFIYLDVACVLFLVPWFFAFMHEAGDTERHGYVIPYLLIIPAAFIGLALSIALDGGFTVDGVDIAAQTWIKVVINTRLPEYALMDNALGASCLIQCMIMLGFASMTVMGTLGRDKVEFEFPWILMILCALTPMTCIGYLHDNTISLIMYSALTGTGVSAMLYIKPEYLEPYQAGSEDGGHDPADELVYEQLSDEDVFNRVAGENAASASMPDTSGQPPKADASQEIPVEELPTSIPWAEIKKLDDDIEESAASATVLSSVQKPYEVVVDNAGFAEEEVYEEEETVETKAEKEAKPEPAPAKTEPETASIPKPAEKTEPSKKPGSDYDEFDDDGFDYNDDDLMDDDSDFYDDKPAVSAKKPEPKAEEKLVQVDDLPGMIPNPLPLPPKKALTDIDFDHDLDDGSDDDMDWNDDSDSDDDFDV